MQVLENLVIDEHPTKFCEGDGTVFNLAQSLSSASWELIKNGTTIDTGTGSNFGVEFPDPGIYRIKVTDENHCSAVTQVTAYEIPVINSSLSIDGIQEVCPNEAYDYEVQGSTNGNKVLWSVINGEINGPDNTDIVSIIFNDNTNPYQVQFQLVNPDFADCISEVYSLEVDRFTVDEEIFNIENNSSQPQDFCTSSYSNFTLDYTDSDVYVWSIEPQELANISDGHGTNQVEVQFNEIVNGLDEGTLSVSAKVCGQLEVIDSFDFNLVPGPQLTVTAPNEVCANDGFTIDVESDIPIDIDDPNEDMVLSFDNGPSVNGTEIDNTNFQFNAMLPNNETNQTYAYSISIQTKNCGVATYQGSIDVKPAPIVDVSSTGGNAVCDIIDINTIFTANVQASGTYTYQWYFNGNPIPGETTNTLNVANAIANNQNIGFGNYRVKVTNTDTANGCSTLTPSREIIEECIDECELELNESISLTGSWTDCDEIQLNGTFTGNPVISWTPIGSFTSINTTQNSSDDYQANYTVSNPGYYAFRYRATYANNCYIEKVIEIAVEYNADFSTSIVCNGMGNYDISIFNLSQYLDDFAAPNYEYTITDLATNTPVSLATDSFEEATASLGEGDYEISLSIFKPGKPVCEATQVINLIKPDASFVLGAMFYCEEENVILSPSNPQPGFTYTWEYQGATVNIENITPNLNAQQDFSISLTVSDPYGCSDTSDIQGLEIGKAEYDGNIIVSGGNPNVICIGEEIDLSYFNFGTESPYDYQWFYNSNLIVGETAGTYTANQGGTYSLYLYDENGCVYREISDFNVIEEIPANMDSIYENEICEGDDFVFTASLSPQNTEYRIYEVTGSGNVLVEDWTNGPEIDFFISEPAPDEYTYLIEYQEVGSQCLDSTLIEFEVLPLVDLVVNYQVVNCNPYTVELSVSNSDGLSGTYLWNNGQEGSNITVNNGGPFRINFQPDNACKVTASIDVPKPADHYSWIFPTGCFEFCPSRIDPYLIGPIPEFDYYSWNMNSTPEVGSGFVNDFSLTNQTGVLNLTLKEACEVITGDLNINISENCRENCDTEIKIEAIEQSEGAYTSYMLYGVIVNPYAFSITIQLSAIEGSFIPSYITIPANSSYDFTTNPIQFIPNANFSGSINVYYEVSDRDGIFCQNEFTLSVGESGARPSNVELKAYPNPFVTSTTISYEFDAEDSKFNEAVMKIYHLNGLVLDERKLKTPKGTEQFNLGNYPSGNYIVVIYQQGERLIQHVLIKK